MAYAKEFDELRSEVKKDKTGTVSFWPKVLGSGNVVPSSASYETFSPDGVLLASGSITPVTVATGIGRLDAPIAAGVSATLGEDYRVDFTWTSTSVYYSTVYFDVVLYPFGPPSVSLLDMLEESIEIGAILERHGIKLGISQSTAQAEMASIYAYRARVELDAMLRDAIQIEQNSSSTYSTPTRGVYKVGRPHMILNRERLNRVERKLAMRAAFASDMTDREGTDSSASKYRYFDEEVQRAFKAIGPIKFDFIEDKVVDAVQSTIGKSFFVPREQG